MMTLIIVILMVLGALCSGFQIEGAARPAAQRGTDEEEKRRADGLLLGTLIFGGAALALLLLGGA